MAMYFPAAFHETRISVLHEMVRTHPLAALITMNATGVIADLVENKATQEAG